MSIAPLENITETAAAPRGRGQNPRTAARLDARAWLRSRTSIKRVRRCGHAAGRLVKLQGAPVIEGGCKGKASGLMSCGSIWVCPVCASKVAYERQKDMELGISRWADGTHGLQAGSFVLLTLTLRHHQGMSLGDVWDGLSVAWRKYVSHRSTKTTLKALGSKGYHRTTEVTYGQFGWHVHLHVLYFLEGRPEDLTSAAAGGALVSRWVDSVAAAGFSAVPNAQDWKVLRGSSKALTALAGYVHKGEYVEGASYAREAGGVAMEVTRSDLKSGRASRTPFEILAGLVEGTSADPIGDQVLWAEWEKHSNGRRQQLWSRGMRATLGLDAEMSDEDLADLEDDEAGMVDLVEIEADEWKRLTARPGAHAAAIGIIDQAPNLDEARKDLCVYLSSLGIRYREVLPDA